MSVFDYINSDLFTPVFDSKLPFIESRSIKDICGELAFAIKNNERVFIYGDYDMDGVMCMMVMAETLKHLGFTDIVYFKMSSKTHAIDTDCIRQAKASCAKHVVICDTGSSFDDKNTISALQYAGLSVCIIDHHVFNGKYHDNTSYKIFNSYEERDLIGGVEISAGYATLLLCNYLCLKFFDTEVPFGAKVYALASMYSDGEDMSTPVARALYNQVAMGKSKSAPSVFAILNEWSYLMSRRFFSFIVTPKFNAAIRMGRCDIINNIVAAPTGYMLTTYCKELKSVHSEMTQFIDDALDLFECQEFADVNLYLCREVDPAIESVLRNCTGLIATRFCKRTGKASVVLMRMNGLWCGSFRDSLSRIALPQFKLICVAGGHDAAFGITVHDLTEFTRRLPLIGRTLTADVEASDVVLSSSLIEDEEDIAALALYNEYCNQKGKVLIQHRCATPITVRSGKFSSTYDLGLPLKVKSRTPILGNTPIMLEPCICSGVELRMTD